MGRGVTSTLQGWSRKGQAVGGMSPNHPWDEKDDGMGGLPEVPKPTERQTGNKLVIVCIEN